MIGDLKTYSATKDTSVSGIAAVPEHWEVVALCAIATTKSVTGKEDPNSCQCLQDAAVHTFLQQAEVLLERWAA